MSATLSSVALADIGPSGGSCSAFSVLFVAAAVIVVVQLVRRRRQDPPPPADDPGTTSDIA